MNKINYPTDEQILILKNLEKRMSIRDIARRIRGNDSPHWIHSQLQSMEKHGWTKNERPGKALGWVCTQKGKEILLKEGFLKK